MGLGSESVFRPYSGLGVRPPSVPTPSGVRKCTLTPVFFNSSDPSRDMYGTQ